MALSIFQVIVLFLEVKRNCLMIFKVSNIFKKREINVCHLRFVFFCIKINVFELVFNLQKSLQGLRCEWSNFIFWSPLKVIF